MYLGSSEKHNQEVISSPMIYRVKGQTGAKESQ